MEQSVQVIQQTILNYYETEGRKLPWRETTDPYKILVSEIMLQQTQVDRVIPKYHAFIKAAPTLKALANLEKKELLQLWQGLGYNNRALRLQQVAIQCQDSGLPNSPEELIKLPGIGAYTSRSIPIFAHNADIVTIDTNIRRIIIHELKLSQTVTEKELLFHAESLLPKGRSRDWHNALMDYGSQVLTAKKTKIKPKSKQSSFKDSDRYYRGQILKKCLQSAVTIEDIKIEYNLDNSRIKKILESMQKDDLVSVKNKKIQIK